MSLEKLFDQNKKWVERKKEKDPEFFAQLSKGQTPKYLWIGCSDSRVPANQIMDLEPGDVFVHRNIANVVDYTDLNMLSVLQYAVEVLQVKHIILCGHYKCGGIKAATEEKTHGLIDNWLCNVEDVIRLHGEEIEKLSEEKKWDRLCELNVREQVKKICRTPIVRSAWDKDQDLTVHGLIFDLHDGHLKNLDFTASSMAEGNKL